MKFKALLLAAGLGTRLRPKTINTPKCLVKIGDIPLLEIWLTKLENAGCESVLINTHYLSDQVDNFLKHKKYGNMKITTTYEPVLLGTAGTLIENSDFFKNSRICLIHADNYTDADIGDFVDFHINYSIPKKKILSMMTFLTNKPESCGIVEVDKDGVVQNFFEKDNKFHGYIANGAIYCFEFGLIKFLKQHKNNYYDFSKEVIPLFINNIQTYHINSIFIDIGTIENLKIANSKFRNN